MSDPEQTATERSPLLPPSSATSQTLVEPAGGNPDDDRPKQPVSVLRGFLVIISMAVLIFLQASNMSLLTTTQSAIAADLDSYSEASWFTSSYLIALSSVVPLAGRASQIFTPRACVLCGSILMACGALTTAFAPSFAGFMVGRVITGIGAACIFPVSILFVLELTSKKRRGLFIGLVNSGFTSGVALGAVIAGALAPALGWRAVFWLQIPLALFAGASVFLTIPRSLGRNGKALDTRSISQKLAKIDYAGMVTLTSSLVLLLFSLASPKIPIAPIIASFTILALFLVIETRYASDPIIPVTILKSRGALFSCIATMGLMLARWTVLFYTPVYAIAIRGWSPASAGSMLVPTNAGFAFGGLMVGWIHVRKASSYYLPCLVVFALFSLTLFTISQISIPSSATPTYMLVIFCNGMCTGAALNYTLAHFLHLTLPDTHVIGTAVLITFRGFAGSIGVATAGGIFGRVLQATLEKGFEERGMERRYLVQRLLGSPALVATLKGEERVVAVEGYTAALKAVFVAGSVLAAVMILVQGGAGWKAPGEIKEEVEEVGEAEGSEQRDRQVE